jgi:acyl carrier protein
MQDEVREFVIDALRQMEYDVSAVTGSSVLGPTGLDLESLAVADLTVQIEDEYKVRMDEEETEKLATMTIDQLAAEVAARIGAAGAVGQA